MWLSRDAYVLHEIEPLQIGVHEKTQPQPWNWDVQVPNMLEIIY